MKYQMRIYDHIWEINRVSTEPNRVVCEGKMPNDPKSCFAMFSDMHVALEKTDDKEVREVMKAWITQ